jgi:hypothetical protein
MARFLHLCKRKLYAIHSYYVRPDLSPSAQDRRIDRFVRLVRRIQGAAVEANGNEELAVNYLDAEEQVREALEDNP